MRNKLIACILLLSASCIQKQDALLVEYDGPPLIQFRCILLPDSPAIVHSIKIQGNAKNSFADTIWYELHSKTGVDKIYQSPNTKSEYFTFKNTTVTYDETYILKGSYLDDTFEQVVKIPSRIQFSARQTPNQADDANIKMQIEVKNNNTEDVSVFFPVVLLDGDPFGRNRNTWRPPDLGFSLDEVNGIIRRNTEIVNLVKNNNLNFTFELPIRQLYNEVTTQFRIQDTFQFYNIFRDILGRPVQLHTVDKHLDLRLKLLVCNSKFADMLANMPENYYAYNTNQFSNVPEFNVPVATTHFRGYALGYYYDVIDDFEVTDLSAKLSPIILVGATGDTISKMTQENCIYFHWGNPITFKMYDNFLTSGQLKYILDRVPDNEKVKLERITTINLITEKIRNFYYQAGSLTKDEFIEHLEAKKPLYFYEG